MPLLMSDVAAGSNAALQLQQNMAAMPNVQQVEANKMQEQQLKLQQEQANVQRSKLANTISEIGIQADRDSRDKLARIYQSPEMQSAVDENRFGDVSRMTGLALMQAGKFEDAQKAFNSATIYDSKKIADEAKTLDNNERELSKAVAVLSSVAEDKIGDTFSRLPEKAQKDVISQIGQENWNNFSNAEKKAVLNNLMLAGIRKNAMQTIAVDTNKQTIIGENRLENTKEHEKEATKRKLIGEAGATSREESRESSAFAREKSKEASSMAIEKSREKSAEERADTAERGRTARFKEKETRLSWEDYEKNRNNIERTANKGLQTLNTKVSDARDALQKVPSGSDAEKKAIENWNNARKERDKYQRDMLEKELDLATQAPDSFKGKQRVIDRLKSSIAAVGTSEEPAPANKGKIAAPDNSTMMPPKGAPSNKLSGDDQAALDWANSNPNDPRAKKIKERLGVK